MERQRKTKNIIFTVSKDNILHIECLPNTTMTIEEGRESTQVGAELLNGQPMPMLCDLTNVIKMSRECRVHFAGPDHAQIFSKCALIVSSPFARIIGNFFLGANKPLRPTKLFNNVDEGLKWLKA